MAGAVLTIDLSKLVANWHYFQAQCNTAGGGCSVSAVVKADAYGLGALKVGPALWAAGCRQFFVAHGSEGAALRDVLPDAEIFVFHGALQGEESLFQSSRLIPVLNSLEAAQRWAAAGANSGYKAAAVQVDTGMNRLGFGLNGFQDLMSDEALLEGLDIRLFMSHLAIADDPEAPMNQSQLQAFRFLMALRPDCLKEVPLSLANSAGVLIGGEYHFDIARVGIGLYGGNPLTRLETPVQPVVKLEAEILQRRDLAAGETVSYGATWRATDQARIATIGVGYADGFLRSGGAQGFVMIGGRRAPIIGRVTMDLIMIDVTEIDEQLSRPGAMVDLLNDELTVDEMADWSGTIGYEVLTALGGRYERRYLDGSE